METSIITKESWDGKISANENFKRAMEVILLKVPENKILLADSVAHKITVATFPGDIKFWMEKNGIAYSFDDPHLGGRGKTMEDIDREEGD